MDEASVSGAAESILNFWFSEAMRAYWFAKDSAVDEKIRLQFGALYQQAVEGLLDDWLMSPQGALALVILLDQFARNMFRDSPQAFAMDAKALQITKTAIQQGFDKALAADEQRLFLYMPYMHSEILADQEAGLQLFTGPSLDYARAHREIIARFGRFPHRNATLGRESTAEELEFLKTPGSGF